MKQSAWKSSLIGLSFLVFGVLGCGSSASKSADPTPANSNSDQPTTTTAGLLDIAGHYSITGANEDGSPYKGELEIIKQGEVYQFRWNAGKQYDGVGVENGRGIAVAFTEGSDGKGCGVLSYQLMGVGAFEG